MPNIGDVVSSKRDPTKEAVFDGANWVERTRTGQTDAAGFENLGGGMQRNQIGAVYREGPRGGFQQVAGPTTSMADEAGKRAAGVNTALAQIDSFDRQLKNTKDIGPLGWLTNPTDTAVLEQTAKDLQLKLKEQPYNLGVLNGPDLDILQSIIADPGQLKSAVFRKTIAPRLANMSKILGEQYRTDERRFEGVGGRTDAVLPPLYRSPSSKYTPDQWGHSGKIKGLPQKGEAAPRNAGWHAYNAGVKAGKIDSKAARGTQTNPYLARDMSTANKLPVGSYVYLPDGSLGVVE